MAYSKFSTRISNYLVKELNYPEEKKEILSYSLDTLLLLVIGYILILTMGWIIGIPGAVLATLLAGDILRKFSGGSHLSNPYKCLTATMIIYLSASFICVQAYYLWGHLTVFKAALLVFCALSLLTVIIYAPVDSAAKPIISPIFRKKLKIASVVVVLFFSALALFFNNSYIGGSIACGLIVQSITLLPVFNKKHQITIK